MRLTHNPFVYWIAGETGRLLRVALGAALVVFGWYHIRQDIGIAALTAGLIVAAAGLLNFCLLAPLWHEPFFGFNIRNDDPMARS